MNSQLLLKMALLEGIYVFKLSFMALHVCLPHKIMSTIACNAYYERNQCGYQKLSFDIVVQFGAKNEANA